MIGYYTKDKVKCLGLLVTFDYIYLIQERNDVYLPLMMNNDYNLKSIDKLNDIVYDYLMSLEIDEKIKRISESKEVIKEAINETLLWKKGLIVDMIYQFDRTYRIAKIKDISRIEVNKVENDDLKMGKIGNLKKSTRYIMTGWNYLMKIVFEKSKEAKQMSWELLFVNIESVNEFSSNLKTQFENVVIGKELDILINL